MNDEYLLQCVLNYKPLYDKSDKGYKSLLQKENCWASVAGTLGRPVAEVKARFKALREKYRREQQVTEKLGRSGAPACTRPVWPLMQLMQFMYQGEQEARHTTSNFINPNKWQDSEPLQNLDSEEESINEIEIYSQSREQNVISTVHNLASTSEIQNLPSTSRIQNPLSTITTIQNSPSTSLIFNKNKKRHIHHQIADENINITDLNEAGSSTPASRRKRKLDGEKRNIERDIHEVDTVLADVSAAINNMNNQKKENADRYDKFSQYIASDLRHLGQPHADILMEDIQVLIINYKRELRSDSNIV